MLGDELRNARDKAKMTQQKLSELADVDRTYISQLENDKQSPSLEVLFRICDALDVPASELIARVEKAQKAARRKWQQRQTTARGPRATS